MGDYAKAAGAGTASLFDVAGGFAGQAAGAGDRGEARNQTIIANQMLQEIKNAPDISKPLILEKYKQAGLLTPEMEQAIKTDPSALAQIGTDQQSLDAQRSALQQMQQRAQGGLTAADRAALAQTNLQTQADTEAKRQQILQQAQAQMGGAGQTGRTLAAQLMAAQGGANQQAANSNQIAQMSSQNALQAAAMSGQLGGQLNQQQFNQAAQKAAAADEMNRFNVQNQIAQQQRNVAAGNQAQAGNLANAQGISNQNVSQQNSELNNQLNRQMQQYNANVDLAKIKAGGASALSNSLQGYGDQAAQAAQNMWHGFGQAAGGAASNALQGKGGGTTLGGSGGGSMSGTNMLANTGGGSSGWAGADMGSGGATGGAGGMDIGSIMGIVGYDGGKVQDFKQGGQVPGQAKVPGDHPINDTVHAKLSPQEIVVPRSLAESKLGKELLKLIHAHNSVKNRLNGHD